MADSVYTAELFGSPAEVPEPALGSDNCHSRSPEIALPSVPNAVPYPLLLLAELELAHDFAVEQHSPATRKAYRSDFALFAAWVRRSRPQRLSCGS
jgi:hypothetical protein